jgi:hypothetical protein
MTGNGFAPQFIGLYDSEYGIRNPNYVPGKFIDKKGGTEYPDDAYRDHHAVLLAFKHKPFGNYPVLRNISNGHFHEKYIVSTNEIDPFDVMKSDEYGNIIFKANLVTDPPHSVTFWNETQLSLIEIEPYGTPADLEKLAKDAGFMATLVQDNKKALKDTYFHRNENKLLLSRVAGQGSTILLLQDKINSLIQNYELYMEQFINLQLEVQDRMSKGIKSVEGQHAFGIQWDKPIEQDISKTISSIKADIRKMNALIEADGILTEGQKQLLFTQVANVLSPDYMKKALVNIIPQNIETASGQQTIYKPTNPTPTTQAYSYLNEHIKGNLSDEHMLENIRQILDRRKQDETNPNSGVQKQQEIPIILDRNGRPIATDYQQSR